MFGFPDADPDVVLEVGFVEVADQDTLLGKFCLELGGILAFNSTEDEIGLGWVWMKPGDLLDASHQPVPFQQDGLAVHLQPI